MRKTNLIDSKDSPRRLTQLVAVGLVVGQLYYRPHQKTPSGHLRRRRKPFKRPSMQQSTMTRRPSSSFSDPMARTLSNPAIRRKTRIFAPSLRGPLMRSFRLMPTLDARQGGIYGGGSAVAVSGSSRSQQRQMATRFGQRASGDSRTQNWQKRIECHGGLPRLRRSADGIRRGGARRRPRPEVCAENHSYIGKQDGLYLGGASDSLVSQPFAEAAIASPSTTGKKAEPYHGYYYLALKSQGPDAAGGAFDYVVNGKMIGGFALIAWPQNMACPESDFYHQSRWSGLRKRSGGRTAVQARQTTRFNPDKSWHQVVLE